VASERKALKAVVEPMLMRERRQVMAQVRTVVRVGHLFQGVMWTK